MALKRKHDDESSSLPHPGSTEVAFSSKVEVNASFDALELIGSTEAAQLGILAACRAALIKTPAASRNALARHRSSIDPALAKALEVVGSYTCKDNCKPLHDSITLGDLATTESLIIAGADVEVYSSTHSRPSFLGCWWGTCDEIRAFFKHHIDILAALASDPSALVSAVAIHCASLSAPGQGTLATELALPASYFDPFFLWAPPAARSAVVAWARNAFIVHLTTTTPPFADLPDDCTGDVLEYFDISMARSEALYIATHCSSSEACSWVCKVVVAALATNATASLVPAAKKGHLATVQTCLVKGANVDVQVTDDNTALIEASRNNRAAIVKLLLEAGADIEAKTFRHGKTALIAASSSRQSTVVKLLLQGGADKEAKEKSGTTALINASTKGCTHVVKVLLEVGVDVEAKTNDDHTAFLMAATSGHLPILQMLQQAGAEVHAKTKNGCTALMYASEHGHADVVEFLLKAGVDIDARNKSGFTALYAAAQNGLLKPVELLLQAGAKFDVKAYTGATELIAASHHGHHAIVKLLLEAGADIEAKAKGGSNALMNASACDQVDVVKLLLEAGADKDARDVHGATALIYAAYHGHILVVETLVQAGADINIVTYTRATRFLFDASGIGSEATVRAYLGPEGYNNERYVREHEGQTAFEVAEARSEFHVADFLASVTSTR